MTSAQRPTLFTFASSANVASAAALPPLESYRVRFRGRQWQITDKHLETTPDGSEYFIEFGRLLQTTRRAAGTFYDWPIHLAEKDWVDLEDFMSMFTRALDFADARPDDDILARTRGEIARYLHDRNDPTYQAARAAWKKADSDGDRYRPYKPSELRSRPHVEAAGSVLPLSPEELRARTWVPQTPRLDR